jgi:hypothetical protein
LNTSTVCIPLFDILQFFTHLNAILAKAVDGFYRKTNGNVFLTTGVVDESPSFDWSGDDAACSIL